MRSFKDYADKAIVRYGLNGYNNLGRELGITKASVSMFVNMKATPSETTMIRLAELAGMPKEEALIDLNLWRSKNNPEVQKIWQRLAKMIGIIFAVLVFSSFKANACNLTDKVVDTSKNITDGNIYYATKFRHFIRRLCYGILSLVNKLLGRPLCLMNMSI